MSPLTIPNLAETKPNVSNLTAQSSSKRELVASWIEVDGKLVCQWLSV
jgi:hypothetical protein